jgi:hypothetical protein
MHMAANRRDPVFRPDHIDAMHKAFELACKRLRLRGTKAAPIIELVAIKIVELARAGEFDTEKLVDGVLTELGINENPAPQVTGAGMNRMLG